MNEAKKPAGGRLVEEFSTETVLALSRDRVIAVHPTFLLPEAVRIKDLQAVQASIG